MFTGIVEAIGSIDKINVGRDGARLTVNVGGLDMADVNLGDSIATNGVCLTVIDFSASHFSADVSNETLSRTSLGAYKPGKPVNLEKAMLPTTRFGGHIVSGHVDAVAKVIEINEQGNSTDFIIEMNDDVSPYIVEKGSVTIDGVSLTVNSVAKEQFRLTIVPHTQQETIISTYNVGSQINLEIDVVARYVERLLMSRQAKTESSTITKSLLAKSGFIK